MQHQVTTITENAHTARMQIANYPKLLSKK